MNICTYFFININNTCSGIVTKFVTVTHQYHRELMKLNENMDVGECGDL